LPTRNSISKAILSVRVARTQVLVEDGQGGVGLDHVGGDLAGALGGELHGFGLVAFHLHDEVLDVQDDVGDILHDAGEGAELVLGSLDLDGGHGRALEGAEEDAAEAVCRRWCRSLFRRVRR